MGAQEGIDLGRPKQGGIIARVRCRSVLDMSGSHDTWMIPQSRGQTVI